MTSKQNCFNCGWFKLKSAKGRNCFWACAFSDEGLEDPKEDCKYWITCCLIQQVIDVKSFYNILNLDDRFKEIMTAYQQIFPK